MLTICCKDISFFPANLPARKYLDGIGQTTDGFGVSSLLKSSRYGLLLAVRGHVSGPKNRVS
jgi:hypothetical protein